MTKSWIWLVGCTDHNSKSKVPRPFCSIVMPPQRKKKRSPLPKISDTSLTDVTTTSVVHHVVGVDDVPLDERQDEEPEPAPSSSSSMSASPSIISACKVHRCRFLKYDPSTITSVAFNPAGDLLAAARQSGDVELWNVHASQPHNCYLHAVVTGRSSAVISSVQWTSCNRLFASSLDGIIREINVATLQFVSPIHANGGPIWCMQYHAGRHMLAVGCEDGRVRLFAIPKSSSRSFDPHRHASEAKYFSSVHANNEDMVEAEPIYFYKVFGSTGHRIVSLAWHSHSDDVLFSGNDEGVIYCWNASSGRNESRMTLERCFAKAPPPVVWSLLVLEDGTVLSGDSNGNVQTWDGKTGTLMQTFAQLTADVLTMAVDAKETLLFASGIDNQVICLRKHVTTGLWSYAYSHRAHTHDVRALAISHDMMEPLLVSGGVDSHLVMYPALKFQVVRPHKISPLPQRSFISLAHENRVLLVQHTNALDLWSLPLSSSNINFERTSLENSTPKCRSSNSNPPILVAQVNLHGASNLICSAISPNGRFIACSTATELKVFEVHHHTQSCKTKATTKDQRCHQPLIAKVSLPSSVSQPAHAIVFTSDSTRLITGNFKLLRIIDMASCSLQKTLKAEMKAQIKTLCVSHDGQWLAYGDMLNHLTVFHLDSMMFYADLPPPHDMHSSLGFHPTGKLLVVTTITNHFACYDVEGKCLSDWSRENANKLPKDLFLREGAIRGVLFHPTRPHSIVLWSPRFLFHIDIEQPMSGPNCRRNNSTSIHHHHHKRRRALSSESHSNNPAQNLGHSSSDDESQPHAHLIGSQTQHPTFHFVDHYGPIAFAGFLSMDTETTVPELVVVETPFFKMLHALPDALHRPKYGQ